MLFLGAKKLLYKWVCLSFRPFIGPSVRLQHLFSAVSTCRLSPRGQYWLSFTMQSFCLSFVCLIRSCVSIIHHIALLFSRSHIQMPPCCGGFPLYGPPMVSDDSGAGDAASSALPPAPGVGPSLGALPPPPPSIGPSVATSGSNAVVVASHNYASFPITSSTITGRHR